MSGACKHRSITRTNRCLCLVARSFGGLNAVDSEAGISGESFSSIFSNTFTYFRHGVFFPKLNSVSSIVSEMRRNIKIEQGWKKSRHSCCRKTFTRISPLRSCLKLQDSGNSNGEISEFSTAKTRIRETSPHTTTTQTIICNAKKGIFRFQNSPEWNPPLSPKSVKYFASTQILLDRSISYSA